MEGADGPPDSVSSWHATGWGLEAGSGPAPPADLFLTGARPRTPGSGRRTAYPRGSAWPGCSADRVGRRGGRAHARTRSQGGAGAERLSARPASAGGRLCPTSMAECWGTRGWSDVPTREWPEVLRIQDGSCTSLMCQGGLMGRRTSPVESSHLHAPSCGLARSARRSPRFFPLSPADGLPTQEGRR